MKPDPRLPRTVYTVNIVPVFAVAIIVYAISSTTKDTRAELRSRRAEERSLFSFISKTDRPVALDVLDRVERWVWVVRFVWVVAVLCEERSLVMSSGTAGGVGVTSWTGGLY